MSEIKTRADLFEAAAKMMRMCDEAGICNTYKVKGILCAGEWQMNLPINFNYYEFPIAIIEGRPVFVGDEVWFTGSDILSPMKIVVKEADSRNFLADSGVVYGRRSISWNPPKPKTVKIEIPIEDAEYLATYGGGHIRNVVEACRKAVESSK